jgi:membrane-associated phospholipid phosphatase
MPFPLNTRTMDDTRRRAVDTARGLLGRASRDPWGRLAVNAAVVLVCADSYLWLNNHLVPRFDFTWPAVDFAIPFLPWTLAVYFSYYAMLFAAAWVAPPRDFLKLMLGMLLTSAVAYASFILLTAHVTRPDPSALPSPFYRYVFSEFYKIDSPGNSMPSLHVALSMMIGLRLRLLKHGNWWLLWAVLVSLSTLTTRQHVVLDVVAGMALAGWVYRRLFGPIFATNTAEDEGERSPP